MGHYASEMYERKPKEHPQYEHVKISPGDVLVCSLCGALVLDGLASVHSLRCYSLFE